MRRQLRFVPGDWSLHSIPGAGDSYGCMVCCCNGVDCALRLAGVRRRNGLAESYKRFYSGSLDALQLDAKRTDVDNVEATAILTAYVKKSSHRKRAFFLSQKNYSHPVWYWGRFILRVNDSLRFFNSRRDQSDRDRSDFALTKTCDETGRRATPIFYCFIARLNAEWEFCGNACICTVLSDLVVFIKIYLCYDRFS